MLFLGTPHHGAPLEKAGHLLTTAMNASPYLAPLDFGKHRSAGLEMQWLIATTEAGLDALGGS